MHFAQMDESTPGGVFGARSRSPGVGAELTSELSHDQADTPSTGWSEHNTEEEVNGSREASVDWVRQLDYLLVNSWSLDEPSDFTEAALFPHQTTYENATFEELTGVMSEPLTPQNAVVSQYSTGKNPLNGVSEPKTSLNGKATPLELSQHPIGELSLSQYPIGELSLSQYPFGDATLSGHYRGNRSQSRNHHNDLSLSQYPITDMSLSQYPITDMSLSQYPIADMSLSQHPCPEATLSGDRHATPSQLQQGNMLLLQHPICETPSVEQLSIEASLSQYLLAGVSGLTEQSANEADNAAVNGHHGIADDDADSLVQHMTSGYSSVVTASSQNSTGLCCPDDDDASLKLDTMSFDHDPELSRVNGKNWAGERLMISGEAPGDAAMYRCTASLDGIPKTRAEESFKPLKGESEGSLFDSGRSESSMSSQSQASVVGVRHDHNVAIAGNLWSEENGIDTMLDTPRDDAGVAAVQRTRQPVCTSTPSSENDSQENIPLPTLLKDQTKKRSLDSLVGHQGPDSGCASLAPSTVASQSYAPSTEALNKPAAPDGEPYMSVGDRARLLGTEIANEEEAIGVDARNETITSQVDTAVGDSTVTVTPQIVTAVGERTAMSSHAMAMYEEELIRTANELGISTTGAQAAEFDSATVDGTNINAPVDTGLQNVTGSLASHTGYDINSVGFTTVADSTVQKVFQNGVSRHETYEELLTSHPSLSQSIGASSIHPELLSGEAGLRSPDGLEEVERPLDAGAYILEATTNSRGTTGPFGSDMADHQPVDATPAEMLIPFTQSHDNLQKQISRDHAVHDRLSQSTTAAILYLPDRIDSGVSAETSSTTSGSTACSVDKDVERIANEYFAILNGGARTNGGVSEKIADEQVGRNNKFATETAVSQYSDSSATTYNELPRLAETVAKIAGSHTLVVLTETGSVDGSSVHSASDTEDALDRDVRRILAKYGRTLSDDEDATSAKARKKNRAPPSDSDDASSLSRRVNNLLNSGRGTETSSVVQPLYLYDDPARSMSIPSGTSSSVNSTVPSLKQAVRTSQDGFRDGARTPSPQSIQSSDSLGQRVQNLLVGPRGQVVAVGNGRRSSMSSQSSVIDYTNLERELDEIQSSLASITSAEGLRSRHGSVSSQVSENAKLGHALTTLASNYALDNTADLCGYAAVVGTEAVEPEGSDKSHKFNVNPMLTSGLVPVDVALDIMHGTAAFDRSTGTVPSHRSAADVGASEDQTSIGHAYGHGRDRNNSNAVARDVTSMYSSDNDGDESIRLLGNDRVQDVSQLVAEILERGSPPRQAYKYLHEAEQHERSLESRRSLGDRSADLMPDGNVLTQNVSGRAASAVNTTSDSFNMSLPTYTPLNAFGTAHSLFSTQLLQFGSESVSPKRQHPEKMSPSISQGIAPGYSEGERRDEKRRERTQESTEHSGERLDPNGHQQSTFRGHSTFVDTPVSTTGGATSDRYPFVVPDTSSVTVTNQSRSRSAVREYERELDRTGAVTREASTSLERRPKSSSPMLRPYRPVGSQEYYYVESWGDDGSISMAMSETTVESTHAGSDDARAPPFPSHVLGSRKDTPQNAGGIYSHQRASPSRELSPSSGGQRLGTIPEQSFESRDTDPPPKSVPRPSPEVTLEKERSFHQTREWLNSASFAATRCGDDEADTSGSVAAQTSSVASCAEAANPNNRRALSPRPLSPSNVRRDQNDLLNSTMFATPQKYGTSFRAAASSPRESPLVEGAGRIQHGEQRREFKGDDRSSWRLRSDRDRRCHSVNPGNDDGQGRARSKDATSRRCYSETPNDCDKFSPLLVDEIEDDGWRTGDHAPRRSKGGTGDQARRSKGGAGDHARHSPTHRPGGSTGQIRSSLPAGQDSAGHQRDQRLSARFESHSMSSERNRLATVTRRERPRSTGSIGMLEEGHGRVRKTPNRYLPGERSVERCLPGTRVIGEGSRLLGGGDLDVTPRYRAVDDVASSAMKSADVTSVRRAAIYEQHADVMSRLQESPPRDQSDANRATDRAGRGRTVPELSRESPDVHTPNRTDATRQGYHQELSSERTREDSRAKHRTAYPRRDASLKYDVISTRDTPSARDPTSTRHSTDAGRSPTTKNDQTATPRRRRDDGRSVDPESTSTRKPVVTFDPRHDPSLPLGINDLWQRFQQIETTLDTLRSTSNSDTSRLIGLLQTEVHVQGGASVQSSPLRIDIPAREFRHPSPGRSTGRQADGIRARDGTNAIDERNAQANVTVDGNSFHKTPNRTTIRNGTTSEARSADDRKRAGSSHDQFKYPDSSLHAPASNDVGSREVMMQSRERNASQNNTTAERQSRQVTSGERPDPSWSTRGDDNGGARKEKTQSGTQHRNNGSDGKPKATAWLIKDETLLSIPEDTTLESLSSDFTTTTATALSTTGDTDIDANSAVVVMRTTKRHLPDDPRLLRLQQKIWRQKEMYRRELQREKRRREKIHKLERLLAEKAQLHLVSHGGGSNETPSTGVTESLETTSDVTTTLTSLQPSDERSSTLVDEESNVSMTDVVCVCHCKNPERTTPPMALQEVDYAKALRRANQKLSEPVTARHSKRRSPLRRSDDAENQPRQRTGKKQNKDSGQRDFGATFPSPMVVSPAVWRTRPESDVIMVSAAVQTSRSSSPVTQDKGGDEGWHPPRSFLQPAPYGKIQLTLEKAKLLAAAAGDDGAFTAHPGGFSWFIPVKKGEKPWEKREPLREFQENIPTEAWPPTTAGESGDMKQALDGKRAVEFTPFNRWTIEKPKKEESLQEAFAKNMQRFISHSHQRMRHMGLKAAERHVQELHRFERVRLFGTECGGNVVDERVPRGSHNKPVPDPYTDHLFKPKRRSLTKEEMKKRTSRVYKKAPEVTALVQEKKKQESYKTNRLRAQLYKQKILNQVLNKRGPLFE